MTLPHGLEQCLAFVNCQVKPVAHRGRDPAADGLRLAVTLSRQAGCGAFSVAEKLAAYLAAQLPRQERPWAVFDRNLVEKVLEDHNLPKRLERFMPEDLISEVADTMDELFGLHPPSWILVRQTADTILRLAQLGNVIIIGRGANIITARLPHVFHVRLVASVERRVEHIQRNDQLSRKAALAFIRRADRGRERYLRKYFDEDIANPLRYHLTVNLDLFEDEQVAQLIGDAVLKGERVGAMSLSPAQHLAPDLARPSLQRGAY